MVSFLFPVLTELCNTSVSAESASPTKSVIWPVEFNLMYPLKINGKWVVKPWVEEDRKEKTKSFPKVKFSLRKSSLLCPHPKF